MPVNVSRRAGSIPSSATVALADAAADLRAHGVPIVDLTAARAPEPTPPFIVAAARQALEAGDTHQTPARGTPPFREACARKLSRENDLEIDPEREVLATLGVKHGMLLGLMALIEPGDVVLIEDPCFASHGPLVSMAGGNPVAIGDPSAWSSARGMILCNPHNPTGAVRTPEELEAKAAMARAHDVWVISDEVYERVTWGGRRHVSIATRPEMRERTLTLMSTTKAYAMGGWRIGFAVGPEPVIDAMTQLQAHVVTCASSFAQAAAAVALGSPPGAELISLWRTWEGRCERMARGLNELPGLRCEVPESGFFAWVDARETGGDDRELARMLLADHRVAVIPGSAFGTSGRGFLRVNAVVDDATLALALERFRAAFQ